jgi:hypothetical protein
LSADQKKIGGMDSSVKEIRLSGIERRSTDAEWWIGSAEKVESDVELTQVGHTDVVSRRKPGAD